MRRESPFDSEPPDTWPAAMVAQREIRVFDVLLLDLIYARDTASGRCRRRMVEAIDPTGDNRAHAPRGRSASASGPKNARLPRSADAPTC